MFWKKKSTSINISTDTPTDGHTDANTDIDTGVNTDVDAGANTDVDAGVNTDVDTGINMDVNTETIPDKTEWIDYEPQTRREAFRYTSTDGTPLFELTFLNKRVAVLDLSAGGLSFKNVGFNENDTDRVTLKLKGFRYEFWKNYLKIDVILKIVHIGSGDICHAIFEHLTTEQSDILHHYILEKQKQDIRRKKGLE